MDMANYVTSKTKQLNLPRMESVERIINLPIVESGWKYAEKIYSKVKKSNSLFTWTLDRAEDSIYNVIDTASTAIFLIERPLNSIDKVLCHSLDIVEQRVPSINLPPEMIFYNTKEYVVRPVLKRKDSLKQIGNSVLSSKYTAFAADKLDGALNVADKYVDKYLPDDTIEIQANNQEDYEESNEPSNKAIQTIHHMEKFSLKLQRRLTKRTLAEAKALKEHSVEAMNVLVYVAQLVVTDPKLALQEGKRLWLTLSEDEPENQARPENLEQLIGLLTRESARRIVHLVNFTTASVGKLPRSVARYVRESSDSCLQMIRSILKTIHLDDAQQAITDGAKNTSHTTLLKQINTYATDTLDHLAVILAEIQQSSNQQDQSKPRSIPQTTITKPTNETYPLRQEYETLQPPTSPNSQFKASHRHIVNGVESTPSS